jgi:DNA-binding Lrp family transcriptional regulator
MDDLDRQLLNQIQGSFPMVRRPYQALGQTIGRSEAEVLERICRLRQEHIIRQVSAIFDTKALGYRSSLVAMRVPPERISQAAQVINEHPGVTHNYERNHQYNLWFTAAVPPTSDLEATCQRLHELAGAESTRIMYTLRLFKIGVNLDMTGQRPADARARPEYSEDDRLKANAASLSADDIALIREIQEDLPVEPEPFAAIAARLGLSQEELFGQAADLVVRGFLRRYAAILYHRRAGFRANGMGVWRVPEEQVLRIGQEMASFAAVSHCYQRPTYPDWPYTVFTMVHGNSVAQCEEILAAISQSTGIDEYLTLYSSREYKKVRLAFYTDDYARWELKYLGETDTVRQWRERTAATGAALAQ